jgi:hypothetical protein
MVYNLDVVFLAVFLQSSNLRFDGKTKLGLLIRGHPLKAACTKYRHNVFPLYILIVYIM